MRALTLKKSQTLFLKLVIIFMGLVALLIAGVVVPMGIKEDGIGQFFPMWVILYLTAIPFYIALYQGFKILGFIDKGTAFSTNSVEALRKIKLSAGAITVLYILCLPFVFMIADMDDAPGLVLYWAAFCGIPMSVSVFAAILEKLFQNMIDIKSENDLTV